MVATGLLGSAVAMLAGGCGLFGPDSADAGPTPEEAFAQAQEMTQSITAVRDRYRELPAAGTADDDRAAEPRALLPLAPVFALPAPPTTTSTAPIGSFANRFGGAVPVDQVPADLQMPEDIYWSFAILLEQGRAGEAFDLLDESTQSAIRPLVLEIRQRSASAADDPSGLSTRELWSDVMSSTSPTAIDAISVRTVRNSRSAEVVVAPVTGDEIPIRFVLVRDGWRMNLEPYVR
ncbi:MAG: hypothetical protein KDA22_03265 [Phycisphaerales bacterium]|nr:hypothetical protein [Phycisphaerales bacterium]